jgi:hypothetical protein
MYVCMHVCVYIFMCMYVCVRSGPTVYLFSLCVVSLLSSRFTASALVWFSNFLEINGRGDSLR